jgi:hypothetical protein
MRLEIQITIGGFALFFVSHEVESCEEDPKENPPKYFYELLSYSWFENATFKG